MPIIKIKKNKKIGGFLILSFAFEMSFLMVLATPLHGAFESNHWGTV